MTTVRSQRSKKAGLPPGTLVFVGEQRVERPKITVIDYNGEELRETAEASPEACASYVQSNTVTWINVTGLHNTDLLQSVGNVFGIHPLVLEDIVNTGQRPRMEDYGDYVYLVLKMLYRREGDDRIVAEQVSFVLGKHYLLSFQEVEGDVFDQIRERLRADKGRIRKQGCDYLAYALLDSIVDNYFTVMEDVGDEIEEIQDRVLSDPGPRVLQAIHGLKSELIFMRRNVWPLREMISMLEKGDCALVTPETRPFLRDVYEHTFQVVETVETLRELLTGALDTYMSSMSNRMNEIMKVLTVIATIFIPLTFIAGVYGMNFEHMPELKWRFGYAGVWALMLAVGLGLVAFFRERKWM